MKVVVHQMTDSRLKIEVRETVFHDGRPFPCRVTLLGSNHFRGMSTELIAEIRFWCLQNLPEGSWVVESLADIAFQSEVFLLFKLRWS